MAPTTSLKKRPPIKGKDSPFSDGRVNETDGVVDIPTLGTQTNRLQLQLESLREEVEFAQHGTDVTGHNLRRKLPVEQRKAKTRKRRQLERNDWMEEQQMQTQPATAKRLRGSRASLKDEVIQGSLVFPERNSQAAASDDDGMAHHELMSNDEEGYHQSAGDDVEESDENGGVDDDDADDDDDGVVADDDDDEEEENHKLQAGVSSEPSTTTTPAEPRRPRKKGLFRLRNFRSAKMAEQHGDALEAHTRGLYKEAIQKLKLIAREAPSAPQVYSSLGMVYCDMLREARERCEGSSHTPLQTWDEQVAPADGSTDKPWVEQLDLAKKAYGAYHVAAILCKKDYSLWVRAADLACEVADIHNLPTDNMQAYQQSERHRWLNEAKNDYQTADNLKPPGIDVPAKLAIVLMELGNLSEALTLLTDLKNRHPGDSSSSFTSSFRAWWLYADLMLQIGNECTRWNGGDESNKNYMFRRWLRKHSKTFDWKERRLQALVKALEAAAGSKSCMELNVFMKCPATALAATDSPDEVVKTIAPTKLDGRMTSDDERRRDTDLLEERQRVELAAFDKTSGELSVELGHESHLRRQKARQQLIHTQEIALNDMIAESNQATKDDGLADNDLLVNTSHHSLPMCASVTTVGRIGSELALLGLDLGLYEFCVLVGTSISQYLQERAKLHEQHYINRAFGGSGGVDADGGDSDSELSGVNNFSDDDELDGGPDNLEGMLKGKLPPVNSVLHGCSLAGLQGKRFLACTFLASLNLIPQEPLSWIVDASPTAGFTKEMGMRDQLPGRTAMYAFVAECLRKIGRTKDLSSWLAPLFDTQVDLMASTGLTDAALQARFPTGSVGDERRLQIVHVVSTSSALLLAKADSLVGSEVEVEARRLSLKATSRVVNLMRCVWAVRSDMSLPTETIELIAVVEYASRLSLKLSNDRALENDGELFISMKAVVSLFCSLEPSELWTDLDDDSPSFAQLPIPTSWLSEARRQLALRVYNLCVATCVRFFSGWESQMFDLSLIRRRQGNHFGILIENGVVSGCINPLVEDRLLFLWDLVSVSFPRISFNFCEKLAARRVQDVYLDARRKQDRAIDESPVALYGEDDALSFLLSFAQFCLLLAKGNDGASNVSLLTTCLSIIMPISQFCVGDRLWDTDIGTVDEHLTASSMVYIRNDCKAASESAGHSKPPGQARRKRLPHAEPQAGVTASFTRENDPSSLSNFVVVPHDLLLSRWNNNDHDSQQYDESTQDNMANLNSCMQVLRHCSTGGAVEKASLDVAEALLDVAATSQNPFLCIEHAARFAARSPKHRVSVAPFRRGLPERDCTALEALIILGRADCLQAVFFCEDAAFLCKFVAELCLQHQSQTDAAAVTSERWRIVSAKAYNVCVALRYTSQTLIGQTERKSDELASWEPSLVKEITRGRSYALGLKAASRSKPPDALCETPTGYTSLDEDMAGPGENSECCSLAGEPENTAEV